MTTICLVIGHKWRGWMACHHPCFKVCGRCHTIKHVSKKEAALQHRIATGKEQA